MIQNDICVLFVAKDLTTPLILRDTLVLIQVIYFLSSILWYDTYGFKSLFIFESKLLNFYRHDSNEKSNTYFFTSHFYYFCSYLFLNQLIWANTLHCTVIATQSIFGSHASLIVNFLCPLPDIKFVLLIIVYACLDKRLNFWMSVVHMIVIICDNNLLYFFHFFRCSSLQMQSLWEVIHSTLFIGVTLP